MHPCHLGKGLQGQPGHHFPTKPERERLLLVTHYLSIPDLLWGHKALDPGKSLVRQGHFGDQSLKPRKDAVKGGGRGGGCEDLPSSPNTHLTAKTCCPDQPFAVKPFLLSRRMASLSHPISPGRSSKAKCSIHRSCVPKQTGNSDLA